MILTPTDPPVVWEPIPNPEAVQKRRGRKGYAAHYDWIIRPSCVIRKGGLLFNYYCRDIGFLPDVYLRLFIDRKRCRIAMELLPPTTNPRVLKHEGHRLFSTNYRRDGDDGNPVYINCAPVYNAFPKFVGIVTPLLNVSNPHDPTQPLYVATYSPGDSPLRKPVS